MINFSEAQKILAGNARSFGSEKISLGDAIGRTLAEPVLADRDYPPFNRASMDGYAIRYADFEKGIRQFPVAATIYAGEMVLKPLEAGGCYKIMTGAPVPAPADTVIRKEDTDEHDGSVQLRLASCTPFQYISRQGEDLRAGDLAIHAGCLCGPAVTGLLASLGKKELLAERLPRVALLTTGNEVVAVDAAVNPAQIRNSNRWLLQSFLKKWGITPSHYGHVPDDRPVLRDTLAELLVAPTSLPGPETSPAIQVNSSGAVSSRGPVHFDIIILSGGVSAGDADYVPGVLEELGVQKLFHKVAIRPGKPVWCGVAGAAATRSAPPGTMVFALPGNPFSCLVNFVLLIKPYLHACFGLPAPSVMELPLSGPKKKNSPLDEFFPVRYAAGAPGSPAGLVPVPINSSGDIRLGLQADGLALHPAGQDDLPEAAMVSYYIF